MKQYIALILTVLALCSTLPTQAQSKSGTKTKSKNTKATPAAPQEVELPHNSNDCLYAIPLELDVPYGPTTAPIGAGRIQEIMRDKNAPYVFEYEHNSVWFKFTVPYNGELNIYITPTNPLDDYDFLVYKYTDVYFSNHLIQNKIKPVAANLSAVDSAAVLAANPQLAKTVKGATKTTAKSTTPATAPKTATARARAARPTLGMDSTGTTLFINKKSTAGFVRPIPVKKGEEYYIVLDNLSSKGSGFTIKASVYVDCFTPTLQFYDIKDKKHIDVDLLILEKNTDNRPIVKDEHFRKGKINLVPGFDYKLYAKREGYFSLYKEFNADLCKEDTALRFVMQQAKVGTVFPITDIYFSDDVELLPPSDTVLMTYVTMFQNYPGLQLRIKGYVQSYGIDMERDIQISQERANVIRNFLVEHGIDASRLSVTGMTENEIRRSAAAALNKSRPFNDAKVEITITEIKK